MEEISEQIKRYAKAHIDACESWPHGGIDDHWVNSADGNLCIQYEDGSWWHYRETESGLQWW